MVRTIRRLISTRMVNLRRYGRRKRLIDPESFVSTSALSMLQAVTALGTYLLVMRLLISNEGIKAVGLWSLTMGFVALFRIVDFSGAHALSRSVALRGSHKQGQATDIDTLSLFIACFYGIVIIVAFYPARAALIESVDQSLASVAYQLIALTAVALPLNILGLAHSSALDGLGLAKVRSIINITGYFIFGIASLLLMKPFGLLGLAYAQFSQYVFVLVISRFQISKTIPIRLAFPTSFNASALGGLLSYSFRLQLSSLPGALFIPLTRVGLNSAAGLEALGLFDLAYRITVSMRAFLQSALNPLLPEFTRSAIQGRELKLFDRVDRLFSGVSALAFGGLMFGSPVISIILTGEIDRDLVALVATLSLAWGVATLFLPIQILGRAKGYLRWSIAGQWLMLAILIGIILISDENDYKFLVFGISLSILVGYLFSGIAEMFSFKLIRMKCLLIRICLYAAFLGFSYLACTLWLIDVLPSVDEYIR